MSPRTPLALALLCALLLAALWVLEHVAPNRTSQSTRTLSALSAAQIERFSLSLGGQSCSLARDAAAPAGWVFTSGASSRRVDGAMVQAGLAELELATRAGYVEGAVPSASHGLQPPRVALTVHGGGGRELVVGFGGEAGPARTFAAVGDQVFVVPARLSTVWGRGCDDLVDLRIFERTASPVRTIRIGERAVTRAHEDEDWRLSPEDALADGEVVEEVLGVLLTLRGAARGGGPGLELELDDGKRRQRAVIAADGPDATRLRQLAARLPSPYAIPVRAATVSRVLLARGEAQVLLARAPDESQWMVGRAATLDATLTGFVPADGPLVRRLLSALARLPVRGRLPPAPTAEAASWRLRIADDRRVHELALRPHEGDRLLLSVRGFGARYVVSRAPFQDLAATVQHWRDRALWSLPPAAVDALTVGDVELRRDARFRWQRVRPSPAEADETRMRELVRLLARPLVERFGDAHPLEGPTATLTVEIVDGAARRRQVAEVALTATPRGHACRIGDVVAYLPARFISRVLELAR